MKELLDSKVLARIKNVKYEHNKEIEDMQAGLTVLLRKFVVNYRSCPKHVFLNVYCKKPMKAKNSDHMSSERIRNEKRKRCDNQKTEKSPLTFNDFVDTEYVYAFIRRCLMHILEYNDQDEESCLLIGIFIF